MRGSVVSGDELDQRARTAKGTIDAGLVRRTEGVETVLIGRPNHEVMTSALPGDHSIVAMAVPAGCAARSTPMVSTEPP